MPDKKTLKASAASRQRTASSGRNRNVNKAEDASPAAPKERDRGPTKDASGLRVRVRMYRQGLGDCFLVSLLGIPEHSDFHMMIDCGVILGTTDAAEKMKRVVGDIAATTSGRVNVLVVTHEHYDHVAGFVLAEDLFASPGAAAAPGALSVGEVWFAWTEDPRDPLGQRLRDERKKRLDALAGLAARVEGLSGEDRAAMGINVGDGVAMPGVASALNFFGVSAGGAGTGATARAMQNAAALVPWHRVFYRSPGEVLELPEAPGIRIYMLGPPRDEAALRKTDSTVEVYHLGQDDLVDSVRFAAGGGGGIDFDPFLPFNPSWSRSLADIVSRRETGATADFIREHYFGSVDKTDKSDLTWRRIDGDWLDGADQLALALDSATNNTSLAIAIELVASGQVLLFPADAQVGNLLSWQRVAFHDGPVGVGADDLVSRTVFYKVGHHGSHNATLRDKELELMPEAGLTAFIPVDEAMAKKKGWSRMPLPSLVEALQKRCGDNLVRIDRDISPKASGISAGSKNDMDLYYDWVRDL